MNKVLVLLFVGIVSGCAVTGGYNLQQKDIAAKAKESHLLDVPIVLQGEPYASAPAVLESLSFYWHKPIFQKTLLNSFPATNPKQGYTISEVNVMARRYGFNVLSLKSDMSFVQQQLEQKRPVVVQLSVREQRYYVLVCGFHSEGLWLMDPGKGIGFVTSTEFQRAWGESGNKLILIAP